MIKDAYDRFPAEAFTRTKPPMSKKKRRMLQLQEIRIARVLKPHRNKEVYERYIHSERWRKFRATVISKRGSMCERCGKFGKVDVHHISYERLGREKPEDVKLYCDDCHRLMHMPTR